MPPLKTQKPWQWPLDISRYDRSPALTASETHFLRKFAQRLGDGRQAPPQAELQEALPRLLAPLVDALAALGVAPTSPLLSLLLAKMERERRSYWAVAESEWSAFLATDWKALSANPAAVYTSTFR